MHTWTQSTSRPLIVTSTNAHYAHEAEQPDSEVVDNLAAVVAVCAGVRKQDVLCKARQQEKVDARRVLMYILRTRFGWTLKRIGKQLAFDHTTVRYAIEQAKGFIKINDDWVVTLNKTLDVLGYPHPLV